MMLLQALVTLAAALIAPAAGPALAERAAIEETIGHYFLAGDTASSAELRLAFHPAAMMFFVKDGRLEGVSQPEWWERADASKTPVRALSRKIPVVDATSDTAVAKVLSEYPTHRFEDYMSLAKIDGRWWIVGKIFHRTVPADAPPPDPSLAAADGEAIRRALEALLAAHHASDVALAASLTNPRMMIYTVLDGRLVGVSAAEWEARMAARRAAGGAPKARRRVVMVDSEGDAAVARLEHERSGLRWIDYASLLKVEGKWQIVGLLYRRESTAGK